MDFSTLEITRDAVPIQLRHPVTNVPLVDEATKEPVVILLVGMDSEKYRRKRREFLDDRLKDSERNRGKVRVSAAKIEDEGLQTLIACVEGWRHVELNGEPLEFNETNFRKILEKCPWVESQVDEAIADRSNFMKTSSTT